MMPLRYLDNLNTLVQRQRLIEHDEALPLVLGDHPGCRRGLAGEADAQHFLYRAYRAARPRSAVLPVVHGLDIYAERDG
jgi:hypothetical protein